MNLRHSIKIVNFNVSIFYKNLYSILTLKIFFVVPPLTPYFSRFTILAFRSPIFQAAICKMALSLPHWQLFGAGT